MKMEALYSFEALVPKCQTKWYHNLEDNMNIHDGIKVKEFRVSDIISFNWAKNCVLWSVYIFLSQKYSGIVKYFTYFHLNFY
jgi:hypothetical protein